MSKVAEAMEFYEIYLDKMNLGVGINLLIGAGFSIHYWGNHPGKGMICVYGLNDPCKIFDDIHKHPSNMDKDDPFHKPFIYVW